MRSAGLCIAGIGLFALLSGPALAQDEAEVQGGPESGEEVIQAGDSGGMLPEMVVEAQNEVRQDIEKDHFGFDVSAAMIDSFLSPMDEEALGVSPVSGLQPHLNNLEKLASDQPPHYWLPGMTSPPVASFYPQDPEGHDVKSWKLTITDFRGSPFRDIEGKGNPPKRLEWDGENNRGEMLKVGYPYSYVFTITDKGTNTYNYAGVGFRIPALDYREEGNRILEIGGTELFASDASSVSAGGSRWLTRAADEVRRHPYSPVRVEVEAETLDLAEKRADAVAIFLAAAMILPREQVETEAVAREELRAEMDGRVRIVVEHAD